MRIFHNMWAALKDGWRRWRYPVANILPLAGGVLIGFGDTTPGWRGVAFTVAGILIALPGVIILAKHHGKLINAETWLAYLKPFLPYITTGEFVRVDVAVRKLEEILAAHMSGVTDPCAAAGRPYPCDVVHALFAAARAFAEPPFAPMPTVPPATPGQSQHG